MRRAARQDGQADRRLQLLVGFVIAMAALAVVVSVVLLGADHGDRVVRPDPGPIELIVLAALLGVANRLTVQVRVRSSIQAIAWTDVAILVGLILVPAPWVVLATASGVAISRAMRRLPPVRVVFGAAKDSIAAALGGLVLFRLDALGDRSRLPVVVSLFVAFLVMTLVSELLAATAIAYSSHTSVAERLLHNWDIQLLTSAGRFGIAALAIVLIELRPEVAYALPLLVGCIHLWHEQWVRTREERQAWQHLAGATESFTDVELDRVLPAAVLRGAELFSPDEIEIELWLDDHRRLVRAAQDRVTYDGTPDAAPAAAGGNVHSVVLRGYPGGPDIGVLRLRFRGPVALTEREQYTLQTFASALDTAVRNAAAYEKLRRTTREHAHAAAHDPLTDLANRRRLEEAAGAALEQTRDGIIALVFIDLNHFKEVNDTLGHLAGDRVLIEVAERLRAAAQPQDLVARLGGDEFAILLRQLPAPALAVPRAAAFLTAIAEPIDIDGLPVTVEASAGIATAPDTGGATELQRRADVAMYQAKRSGQRLATYAPDRDTANMDRLTLTGQLRSAVAHNEFRLAFQPIVDLASGTVVAAEALARWQHPQRGELHPRWFLETLERSEQLPAFTAAMLDQALAAAAAWAAAGHPLTVSVNISPRSLLDHTFPRQVATALAAHRVTPARLCLELTETLAVSQVEVVDRVLGQLRRLGVRLALDDFGTGFSSLAVLSRIPVHQLKIDRAFVRDMHTLDRAAAVVRSTVEMASGLNLDVVAEGVETETQRRTLWELGCAAGQGHLFGRPVPPERLTDALARGYGDAPGVLAPPLHDAATVLRLPRQRRPGDQARRVP